MLRPKSFEVLAVLIERHSHLVSREELIRHVWPDVFVADESVTKCIFEIRKALDDDAQQLIRTVARRGYVFTAPVTTPVLEFPRAQMDETSLSPIKPPLHWRMVGASLGLLAVLVVLWLVTIRKPLPRQQPSYEQLTNFTDSAVSPALSPDGKMLAFLRSDKWYGSPDQIYVKILPSGEPVQVTSDPRPKYGPEFTPDGSRIAYTVFPWATVTVPALGGGDSTLLLKNAAGLSWLNEHRILFSEIDPPGSLHMGVVTADEDRSNKRIVYFPKEDIGMVHLSYASPDHRWVLAVEKNPFWQPCRLVPLDGSSSGHPIGPKGLCTSAGWSPNGKWMYFSAQVAGEHHLWRQKFPDSQPEQITSGLTEEEGIAVMPDGHSLITSIGTRQGALWIYDSHGNHALSSQGYVSYLEQNYKSIGVPRFTRDGQWLYYVRGEELGGKTELWRANLASEKSEKVLPGISMTEYDISDDGKEVVYSIEPSGKPVQIWLAATDRSSSPRLVSTSGGDSPRFGPDGVILYRTSNGQSYFLERMNKDGSRRSKVVPFPVGNLMLVSPDRRWIMTAGTVNGIGGTFAVPTGGGAAHRICNGCPAIWAPDGRFLYVGLAQTRKTRVLPLARGEMLPKLPPLGRAEDSSVVADAGLIDGYVISPGSEPSIYAYVKVTIHRNLFRIPLRLP